MSTTQVSVRPLHDRILVQRLEEDNPELMDEIEGKIREKVSGKVLQAEDVE